VTIAELPDSLTPLRKRRIFEMAEALGRVSGVAAVVLAGSHARGRARDASDIDLGLLYAEAEPLDVASLRKLCREWQRDAAEPLVTEIGEWGPWVDGGAWLLVDGARIDLLYRSFELIGRVWREADAGSFEHHWGQQAPFGFFSPTVLGEVLACRVLHAGDGRLDEWKRRVSVYPEALRAGVTQALLWQVEFNLASFLPKFVARGDPYGATGCLARAAHHLVLVLFALDRRYPLNEKTTLEEIAEMPTAPERFGPRVREILGGVGTEPAALADSAERMERLFRETVELAEPLYTPRRLPRGPG
jgi:predicted nucleotidyltransferase